MPLDYTGLLGVQRPLEKAIQGYQVGTGLEQQKQDRAFVNEQRQQQQQAVQAQQEQARAMQADLAALAQDPNAGYEEHLQMQAKYPALKEHFKTFFDTKSAGEKDFIIKQGQDIVNMLQTDNIDMAINELEESISAADNSGDTQKVKGGEAILANIQMNPEAAKTAIIQQLAGIMEPQQFKNYMATAGIGGKGTKKNVQSSNILDTGEVQIVLEDGTTELVSPGAEAEKRIKAAHEFSANLQGLRGAEREAAKNAQKTSFDYFKQIEPITKNIANLNEGIRLIDAGAETGAIAKHFPSIKAASVKLQNLQGQLGLDVLHSTTFGALSAAELKFALSTALPTGLDGEPLKEWMRDKRDSQIKLSNYMNEAAIYLGTPGNTIASFMEKKKEEQKARESEQQTTQGQTTQPKKLKFNPSTGLIE